MKGRDDRLVGGFPEPTIQDLFLLDYTVLLTCRNDAYETSQNR